MKAIKIIVTILIIITVVFFGTGLIVKQSDYVVEVKVDKPISEVFKMFNDQSTVKDWIPEFLSIDAIDIKEGVTGSIYDITVDNKGQKSKIRERILAYVENEKVTFSFDREGVFKTDDYIFKGDGTKTTIVLNSSYQAKSYIFACVLPYFKGTFKELDQKYLNNFKAFAEK
tara:strand:- start:3336 stop:3848 length:513 start_codon:yes stop_codon:yes gene_type:complete